VNGESIDDTFTVTVMGPSYPGGHDVVFTLEDGVLSPEAVTLDPIIPGNYTISEADAGTEWNEEVSDGEVTVVKNETAEVTVTNTYVPGSLEVTKVVEIGDYSQPVNTSFAITVTGPSYPGGTTLTFEVVNGVVEGAQTLENLIPGEYTVSEDNGANVAWTVTGEGGVVIDPGEEEGATVTNTIKQPNTTISVTADTYETLPGGNVILTIADTNDGAVPLANNTVTITYGPTTTVLDMDDPEFVGGDTNNNDLMDPGETWTWVISIVVVGDTTVTVDGSGVDPLGNDVSPETGYDSERDTVAIRTVGTTRTIGFWQTHTTFTSYVFANLLGGSTTVGFGAHKGIVTNILEPLKSELFGGFYAAIAKTTTGGKRTPIDQARIQMLQQLLAAKLNCAAFGCSSSTKSLIASADVAYAAGTNKGTIISLAGQLDAFNNSGDAYAIPANLPATGKATPKDSKNYANLVFWNIP
jgi:hypothetical protein